MWRLRKQTCMKRCGRHNERNGSYFPAPAGYELELHPPVQQNTGTLQTRNNTQYNCRKTNT